MSGQIQDLPLLDLFDRLRAAGLPLGVDEYALVLSALQQGYGLPDAEALAALCCMLWTSSREEAALLRFHFAELIARPPARRTLAEQLPAPAPPSAGAGGDDLPAMLSLQHDLTPYEGPVGAGPRPPAKPSDDPDPMLTLQIPSYDQQPRPAFLLGDEYYPVTGRQMKQIWRYLRRPVREGPPVELDVDATIRGIERTGLLLAPVLVPRRANRVKLVVLADQHGSMMPFHDLTSRVILSAQRGGRLGGTEIYYFHNTPDAFVYRDPALSDAVGLEERLRAFAAERAVVLIISDAGAARGGHSPARVRETAGFVGLLRGAVRRAVWLNPMPAGQWAGTSAAAITRLMPMFELSRRGLQGSIDTLRGRAAGR